MNICYYCSLRPGARQGISNKLWQCDPCRRGENDPELDAQAREARAAQFRPHEETLVHVWAFDQAPLELSCISDFGGDEDWLAFVPAGSTLDPCVFMRMANTTRSWCFENGARVVIGAS